MVLRNCVTDITLEHVAFVCRHTENSVEVMTDTEDRLPSRHRVRPDDGVHRLKQLANILRRAALAAVDLESGALGRLVEPRLRKSRRQGLQEALQRARDAVVDLIPGGPESI